MAKKSNESDLSGLLGEQVTVRKVGKKVLVKNRPKMQRFAKPGDKTDPNKLEEAQNRFLEAVQYAKRQIALPESKELYTAGISSKKRSAYLVAMSDYLSAPKVHSIDALGYKGKVDGIITVKATDDFMVTGVRIVITDKDGTTIEEGEAGPDLEKINLWSYKATVANPSLTGTTIKAIAYDRPGNTGTLEVKL